jgi:hypothetical protein
LHPPPPTSSTLDRIEDRIEDDEESDDKIRSWRKKKEQILSGNDSVDGVALKQDDDEDEKTKRKKELLLPGRKKLTV